MFSIDGSFAASVSIMGSDPKVRAGAVDVVRYPAALHLPLFSLEYDALFIYPLDSALLFLLVAGTGRI